MKRFGFQFYWYIGKNKMGDGVCLTITPTVMLCSSETEYTFIFSWIFWSFDIYYIR